ncbi:DNA-directed RNA polymerase subunit beta', partial [Candidatus Uhrbacteria bacterium]|nr:DNA-directed RNA polymerase subunit beta' [Candidatus Uhrbacteria bacterium]
VPEKLGFINGTMDAKELRKIVNLTLELYGQEYTASILDKIKDLGFEYTTLSGLSWGMDDIPSLPAKKEILAEAEKKVDEIEEQYEQGLLTQSERYTKIIDVWTEAKDRVVKISKDILPKNGAVASMVDSGARGSWGQLTQIVGMKGLVANPAGEIIELPVKSSFKEGFDILEYFISSHGSRKGLSDTALRTANAGYLTRRLVDVAQDVIIREMDCGTEDYTTVNKHESAEIGKDVADRLAGRTVMEDLKHPQTGEVLVEAGEFVTEPMARDLRKLNLDHIKIRSVLKCESKRGICQKCYGYDLGYLKPVGMGTAVGIIAAQSIGEPGTQLTMRTFHTGGVVGQDITQGLPRVEEIFEARPPKRKAFIADIGGEVKIEEVTVVNPELGKRNVPNSFKQKVIRVSSDTPELDVYPFWDMSADKSDKKSAKDVKEKVKVGDKVREGQLLFVGPNGDVVARRDGEVKHVEKDKIVMQINAKQVREYPIPSGYSILVKDGQKMEAGDQLTEGSVDLHQLHAFKGVEATQKYIIKEIQLIYSSQGQKLNDKHVEIIARQMFNRVLIKESRDSLLLPGEIIEKSEFMEETAKIKKAKGKPANVETLLLGITKVSLTTRSFLSAASFQETPRVLINAAITGKIDYLEGLKENVIIGRLIPVGPSSTIKGYNPAPVVVPAEPVVSAPVAPEPEKVAVNEEKKATE